MSKVRPDTAIPAARDYRATVGRLGWCLVIMFGLMQTAWPVLMAIGDAIYDALPNTAGFVIKTVLDTVGYLQMFIIPGCLFYTFSKKKPPFAEPIRVTPRMPAYFPLLILAGLSVILVTANVNAWFIQLLTVGAPEDMDSYLWTEETTRISAAGFAAMMCTDALAPAFAEEFLFRGVIYGNLRRYGRPAAMTISALCFALMHQNAAQTFYTFAAGLVMAACYELTGSIWCSVFLHLFNNLYANIAQMLPSVYGERIYPVLQLIDTTLIVVGAAALLWLLVIFARKARTDGTRTAPRGLFGYVPDTLPEVSASHPDTRTAARHFWAPGMTVFTVLALVSAAMTILILVLSPYFDFEKIINFTSAGAAQPWRVFCRWYP